MNILYIGSSGALSLLPFKKLLSTSHTISAKGVYKPIEFKSKIIALENESLALAANQNDIPLIDLSLPIDQVINRCEQLSIDLIFMSCYSKRLPDELINLPALGCFNMHPSLLPKHRGSEPVFWQMQQSSDMGVSWHRVVNDFDAGDIVAQKKVHLTDGDSYAEINHCLANTGATLVPLLLEDIVAHRLVDTPQDSSLASYESYPTAQDFIVDTAWSAQHAYNFMRATETYGQPYMCHLGNARYLLDKAVDYDNNDSIQSVEVQGDRLYIPCNEGVLMATFTGTL